MTIAGGQLPAQASIGSFSFELALRHPSRDPTEISQILAIQPKICWKAGDESYNKSIWRCEFARGIAAANFEAALEKFIAFISGHGSFLQGFYEDDGEIELILNSHVEPDHGRVLDVRLSAWFLQEISENGVGLQLNGWMTPDVGSCDDEQVHSGGGVLRAVEE
jgi:hypothetical protein